MKKEIHPSYAEVELKCTCGAVHKVYSTLQKGLSLDVCGNCHPFYTGKQKTSSTNSRVNKFKERYSNLSF